MPREPPGPRKAGADRGVLQITTRHAPDLARQLGEADVPGLTVLCHPEPRRVGEVAALTGLLSGEAQDLSRLAPHFAPPEGGTPRPLADPHLSRRPVRVSPAAGGGVRLDPGSSGTPVAIGGAPLTEPRDFDRAALAEGVAVLLGDRTAVLLRRALLPGRRPPAFGLVGESAGILRVRQEVQRLADLDYPVLLRGESGTGKELVARALHRESPRCGRPYVCVNLGAVPPSLAAAELFGAVRGAFTDAAQGRPGSFRSADGGTLFLDEIGDTPQEIQPLLLRALETGRIQPVGTAETVAVDVRLVSATDVDLEAAIASGGFRSALYHRLAAYELEVPPLRDRREDVGRLFFHFLRLELAELGEAWRLEPSTPDDPPWVPADLVVRLAAYGWPGNVRELRNVVRQLVVVSRGEAAMRVPARVERLLGAPPASTGTAAGDNPEAPAAYRHPDEVGEDELVAALRSHRWNVRRTAAALNLSRTSLNTLIDRSRRVRRASDLERREIEDALRRHGGDAGAASEDLEVSKRALRLRMTALGL